MSLSRTGERRLRCACPGRRHLSFQSPGLPCVARSSSRVNPLAARSLLGAKEGVAGILVSRNKGAELSLQGGGMAWIKETKKQGVVSKNKTLRFPFRRRQCGREGAADSGWVRSPGSSRCTALAWEPPDPQTAVSEVPLDGKGQATRRVCGANDGEHLPARSPVPTALQPLWRHEGADHRPQLRTHPTGALEGLPATCPGSLDGGKSCPKGFRREVRTSQQGCESVVAPRGQPPRSGCSQGVQSVPRT